MEAVEQVHVAGALHVLGQRRRWRRGAARPTLSRRCPLPSTPGPAASSSAQAQPIRQDVDVADLAQPAADPPSSVVVRRSHAGSRSGPYVLRSERSRRHATLA